jgi:hypothetical protein
LSADSLQWLPFRVLRKQSLQRTLKGAPQCGML